MWWLREFFEPPQRQAAAWAVLGILGIVLATIGLVFVFTDSGSGGRMLADTSATRPAVTPAPTRTPTRATPTPTATPTATASPAPTATLVPPAPSPPAPATPATPAPTATPTSIPVPTETPTATATPSPTPVPLVYCASPGTPPLAALFRLAGLLTIGGAPAAANTSVNIVVGGVVGPPGVITVDESSTGYRVDVERADPSDASCANRVGAELALLVNGQLVPTGRFLDPVSSFAVVPIAVP